MVLIRIWLVYSFFEIIRRISLFLVITFKRSPEGFYDLKHDPKAWNFLFIIFLNYVIRLVPGRSFLSIFEIRSNISLQKIVALSSRDMLSKI